MEAKSEDTSRRPSSETNGEMSGKMAVDPSMPGHVVVRILDAVLVSITNVLAGLFGRDLVRRHFHLFLSTLVLFGPVLSLWASKYSIFANRNHYLYRKFLLAAWGWTCTFTASFTLLLSLSARRSLALSLRHLSRLAVVACLWWVSRRLLTLLEDAAGTCYEPMAAAAAAAPAQDGAAAQGPASAAQPLLLLHQDQTRASCLKAGMQWRGYEISQDTLILCLCCLLIVEEVSVFGPYLARAKPLQRPPGAPLRIIFLLCVLLLNLWMFLLLCLLAHFPHFPSQQLGGALGYLGWRALYQGWYKRQPSWGCPGLPDAGLLATIADNKQLQ